MSLKLVAKIEHFDSSQYYAYIDSIKGMGETGESPEDAMKELLISLKVKLAYDLGIDLDELKESIVDPLAAYTIEQTDFIEGIAEKEINLMLC